MTNMITTHDLSKRYGDHWALNQVNIKLDRGDIYGLVGRNGAGKTTLMKIINGQIFPTSGHVDMLGKNLTEPATPSPRIGCLIEAPGLHPNFSARQNLALKCQLCGIKRPGYCEHLIELVQLNQAGDKKVKKYSLGMKQRLGLAMALVGDPDILLLDEPTNGMDPQGIAEFRQIVARLNREENMTIMISSHILGELAKYITKIGIIHEGQLIYQESMETMNAANQDHYRLVSQTLPRIVNFLEEKLNIHHFKVVTNREVHIYEALDKPEKIIHPLIQAGLCFEEFSLERASLEAYFMALTGGIDHA